MKVTPYSNNYSFGQNNQNEKSKNTKNWALGVLSYATICAVFPHDYEKMVDKIDINFKELPLQGKVKNVAKAAVPFFAYPLAVLLGLKLFCEGYKKITDKKD